MTTNGVQDFTLEVVNRNTGGRLQTLRTADYPTPKIAYAAAELAMDRWLAVLPWRELCVRVQTRY